jgi:hypothetical protein
MVDPIRHQPKSCIHDCTCPPINWHAWCTSRCIFILSFSCQERIAAVIKAIITCMQFFFTAASCTLHLHSVQKLIGKSNTVIAYVYCKACQELHWKRSTGVFCLRLSFPPYSSVMTTYSLTGLLDMTLRVSRCRRAWNLYIWVWRTCIIH